MNAPRITVLAPSSVRPEPSDGYWHGTDAALLDLIGGAWTVDVDELRERARRFTTIRAQRRIEQYADIYVAAYLSTLAQKQGWLRPSKRRPDMSPAALLRAAIRAFTLKEQADTPTPRPQ